MKIKTDFIIGDRWVYYKIFSGPNDADNILCNVIKPLLQNLQKQKVIRKWFFIRYNIPSQHLRIRFELTSQNFIGNLISSLYNAIAPYYHSEIISNLEICTYKREIERYGSKTIEQSEKIFYYDSEMILSFLDSSHETDLTKEKRWLFGLQIVDFYLDSFDCSIKEKLSIMEEFKNSFAQEFGLNKHLKKQLEAKYRKFQPKIDLYLKNSNEILSFKYCILIKNQIQQINDFNSKNRSGTDSNVIHSYIHMSLNRLFSSGNRKYEFILYYFLFRFYQSSIAKRKYLNK